MPSKSFPKNLKTYRRLSLFGVPVDVLLAKEAIYKIQRLALMRSKSWVLSVNPQTVSLSLRDEFVLSQFKTASLSLVDGIGTVWALKVLFGVEVSRISGVDVLESLFEIKGMRFFFLGSRPGIAEQAAKAIEKKHSNIKVVGWHHGYFKTADSMQLIKTIKNTHPHILVLCLGQLKQEKWLLDNWRNLPACVILPVGGALDILSGSLKRAPKWVQSFGLEWAYRTLQEPKRLLKFGLVFGFLFKVILSKIFNIMEKKGKTLTP